MRCEKCGGSGLVPGVPLEKTNVEGKVIQYPTVARCPCRMPAQSTTGEVVDMDKAARKLDAQERAAGEKKEDA